MDKNKARELALRVRSCTGAIDALNMREEIASAIEELAGVEVPKTEKLSKLLEKEGDNKEALKTVERELEGVATTESHSFSNNEGLGDTVVTDWGDASSSYIPPLSEEEVEKPKKAKKKKKVKKNG